MHECAAEPHDRLVQGPAASAAFLTELFGLPPATRYGPFLVVEAANGVSLDYHETDG